MSQEARWTSSRTAPRLPSDRLVLATPVTLLQGLEAAHREVEASLDEMDLVAGDAVPDAVRFASVRLRAGQAILAKRQITTKVCNHLIPTVAIEDAEAIRDLKYRDSERSNLISDHVRRWTPDAITNDWQGYCQASREMRGGVREMIVAEKRLLYPLLNSRR